jgi:hypothetical protein
LDELGVLGVGVVVLGVVEVDAVGRVGDSRGCLLAV